MQRRAFHCVIPLLLALLAPVASGQQIDVFTDISFYDFGPGLWEQFLIEGPFLDDVTATGIASLDLDPPTPPTRPELLVYQGTTITWHNLDLGTTGTFAPAPPASVDALVGLQLLGTPDGDLVMASGNDLWVLDRASGGGWIGPFAQTFTPASLAAANVLGSPEEELIASDGTQVFALDLTVIPLVWTTLLAPPGPVDSIAGVDLAFTPPAATIRLLAAHVGDTTHHYLPASLVGTPSWAFPQMRRFGISSAAPIDYLSTAPLSVGNMLVPTPIATSAIRLADVAASAGLGAPYQPGGDGHCPGAVLTDLDGDLDADLYLVRGDLVGNGGAVTPQSNLLYTNNGGGVFTAIAGAGGAGDTGNSAGAIAADFTGDGLRDLYVINFMGSNTLYQRNAAGGYTDVTGSTDPTPLLLDNQAGLGVACDTGETEPACTLDATLAAAAGDIDRDGDLDIFVGNQLCCQGFTNGERDVLYRNDGNLAFTDITVAAGIEVPNPVQDSSTQAVLIADLDNNLWPDIFITHKGVGPQREQLFLNDGDQNGDGVWDGTFSEWFASQPDPRLGNVTCAAMGVDAGDYDNDGDLDLFLTDISSAGAGCAGAGPTDMDLYRNLLTETGSFSLTLVEPNPVASPSFAWGASWMDLDNDGDQEIHVASVGGQLNWIHRNDSAGAGFADVTIDSGGAVARNSRTSIPADIDRDGRIDLLVAHQSADPVSLFQNQTPVTASTHWLEVHLVGNPALPGRFRSTVEAVGARINVTAGGRVQRRDIYTGGHSCGSTRDYVAHFGLGAATVATRVEVLWPSGRTTVLTNQAVDQVLTILE